MSVTIYDIAEEADVSIATVSRVFNGHPRVSERTRSRVLEVAQRHNYQPHASARDLARKNSYVISAVIPMLTNYFFMEVLRGVQEALADSDFDLTVYSVLNPDQVSGQLERAVQRGRSEGVLVFSTWLSDETAEWLAASIQPVVLVDSTHAEFDWISVNNVDGGYLATRHLLDMGSQRIGLLAADAHSAPARDRRAGYEKALREADIEIDESLIAGSRGARLHGFSEGAGYKDMLDLLNNRPDVDGIFAMSDVQALGAIKAAREKGLRIPEDANLIGYDDIKMAEHVGLTTIKQPMYEMGQLAVKYMMKRLNDPGTALMQRELCPELVVRRTSAADKMSRQHA